LHAFFQSALLAAAQLALDAATFAVAPLAATSTKIADAACSGREAGLPAAPSGAGLGVAAAPAGRTATTQIAAAAVSSSVM
jgi:hypothetical protein